VYCLLALLMAGDSYSLATGLKRSPRTSELFLASLNVRLRLRRDRAKTRTNSIQGFTFSSIGSVLAPLSKSNPRNQIAGRIAWEQSGEEPDSTAKEIPQIASSEIQKTDETNPERVVREGA
jgi:hypothetical protein